MPLPIAPAATVAGALAFLRRRRARSAPVTGPGRAVAGLVGREDLLARIMGEFDDEADRG